MAVLRVGWWARGGLSGSLWVQSCFHNNTQPFFCLFHWVDIYADRAKATMGKTAGSLPPSKGEAPNCISSHRISWPPIFKINFLNIKKIKKHVSLESSWFHFRSPWWSSKNYFITSWPLSPWLFNLLCDETGSTRSPSPAYPGTCFSWGKATAPLNHELTSCLFTEHHFYFRERLTDYGYSVVGIYLADIS